MGLLRRLFGGEQRSTGSAHPRDPVIAEWWGETSRTASGASVTPDSAMRVAAVYACVGVRSKVLASMPLIVYRRKKGGKERATDHPLYDLLHDAPNPRQTSFEWREMLEGHVTLRGNAYCRKIENPVSGRIEALIPLHPDRVTTVEMPGYGIAFRYTPEDGPAVTYMDREILRVPGFTMNGREGLNPIQYHRETVGLSMAAREYLARFYSNSSSPKGGVKLPQPLSGEAVNALRDSFERRHRGVENSHRLLVLDGGMEWFQVGISNDDAQYLELQQFNVGDIARIFGVPPHKIGDLSKATFSNIEHQSIEFVTDTVLPMARRWESRLNRSLLSPEDRKEYFIGLELKGLLRGDSAARGALWRELFMIGAATTNDVRRGEDMDEIDGGDVSYVPLNMAPADKVLDVLLRAKSSPNEKPGRGE